MTDPCQSHDRPERSARVVVCRCPKHCPAAIAQARLDPDTWALILWPWLTAVDRACPSWGRAMARIVLTTVRYDPDGTLTVDVGRDYGMSRWTTARALARLTGAGLLTPLADGARARIVLPDD